MKNNYDSNIFRKVLTIGPSIKSLGGMAAVMQVHRAYMPDYKLLPTNSPCGTFAGAFVLLSTMVRLPFYRLAGRTIMHVHSASGKSFLRKSWLINLGRALGFKVVFHSHGGQSQEYFRKIGLVKAKRVLSRCSALVVLSDSWKEYYDSTFHLPNIAVVHNPIVPCEVVKRPSVGDRLELLFLGTYCDSKGIFDLLEVLAVNKDRWMGRVHLSTGGTGDNERLEEYIRENGLAEMVTNLGWVSGSSKEQLFNTCHALILPSYIEGLPMSILEAMAHGMPVISTPVGGIPEVVQPHENGFLVRPGDKKAIATAIDCYLLNPELVTRHGAKGLKMSAPFNAECIINQLREIYESL